MRADEIKSIIYEYNWTRNMRGGASGGAHCVVENHLSENAYYKIYNYFAYGILGS